MGQQTESTSRSGDDRAVTRALVALLAQALTLANQLLAARTSDEAEDLSPEDRDLLDVVSELTRDSARSDPPRASTRPTSRPGVPLDALDKGQDERQRRRDVFAAFERIQRFIPSGQWQVVCLYYRDGLTEQQIADRIGVSRAAVYRRRKRVERRLSDQERALRKERLQLVYGSVQERTET